MESDRELLELAAKAVRAAGANIIDSEAGPQIFERYASDGSECYRIWLPNDDDGDALRLLVKLGLTVSTFSMGIHVKDKFRKILASHPECKDVEAPKATRRAIVCAAAEIGRQMLAEEKSANNAIP